MRDGCVTLEWESNMSKIYDGPDVEAKPVTVGCSSPEWLLLLLACVMILAPGIAAIILIIIHFW